MLGYCHILSSLDADALAFCARSGATDRRAISDFCRAIKGAGWWSSMICWPLATTLNASTGSIAYSLGGAGIFDGTLVNGPTHGSSGLTFNSTSYVATGWLGVAGFNPRSIGVAVSSANSDGILVSYGLRNTGQCFGVSCHNAANVLDWFRWGDDNDAAIPSAVKFNTSFQRAASSDIGYYNGSPKVSLSTTGKSTVVDASIPLTIGGGDQTIAVGYGFATTVDNGLLDLILRTTLLKNVWA